MAKRTKRYQSAADSYEHDDFFTLDAAVGLIKQNATAKFDETIELHVRTALDPRHADQQVRGTAMLPHGLGKEIRVAVFAEGDAARSAEEAGAETNPIARCNSSRDASKRPLRHSASPKRTCSGA